MNADAQQAEPEAAERAKAATEAVLALAQKLGSPVMMSTWPRARMGQPGPSQATANAAFGALIERPPSRRGLR